jgi:cyclomaltodextrinase
MAKKTNINWRSKMIYQVFPRQHSKTRDFQGVIEDLPRIKKLGTDIIYLLPIHTIGQKDRKGTVGSPYSIYDYYSINPEYGTLDDFKRLIKEAHKLDMLVMIDIVINHTSRDSILTKKHPDWFYRRADGSFRNRVGDWSDITDLDFSKRPVWDYLIEVLVYWAQLVDGFRCDVAPLVPLDFWREAKTKVNEVNPNLFWLTESVHPQFIKYIRDLGYDAFSDSEMYQVFDACYDYDIDEYFRAYLTGKGSLQRWLEEVQRQECIYPKNYVKLRHLENHDQERIASYFDDVHQLINLTALNFFFRGMPFIYAGQEFLNNHRPSLFEYDPINYRTGFDISKIIKRLKEIHEDDLITNGNLFFLETKKAVILKYENQANALFGYFNLGTSNLIDAYVKDGIYQNLIDNSTVKVNNGKIEFSKDPIIIKISKELLR